MRCENSLERTIFASSSLNLSIVCTGVPAGASMPTQGTRSNPSTPLSDKVGIEGSTDRRSDELTAIALTLPPARNGCAPAYASNDTCTSPAARSVSDLAEPT